MSLLDKPQPYPHRYPHRPIKAQWDSHFCLLAAGGAVHHQRAALCVLSASVVNPFLAGAATNWGNRFGAAAKS
jgi:hypothetical protein